MQDDNDREDTEQPFDKKAAEEEIKDGADALKQLMETKHETWARWSLAIKGLRSLHNLVCNETGTRKRTDYAYRQAMGAKLQQKKYAVYDLMDKQTRGTCYRLMDRIEDIDRWYLTEADQLRWNHPDTIAKHCPPEYVSGAMRGHNKPPAKTPRGPSAISENARLKKIIAWLVKRLEKHEPGALEELELLIGPMDPSDPVDDVAAE